MNRFEEAKAKLDAIDLLLKEAQDALPDATTDEDKQKVLDAVTFANKQLENMAIEKVLVQANPKQVRAVNAFYSREYKAVGLIGGNRSGKTIAIGWMCFAKHLRDHAKKGETYWCISPNAEKSVSGQQHELWQALPRWMFGDQTWDARNGFGAQKPVIILEPNGRKIIVRLKTVEQYANDPNSFESEKLAGVWVDESLPQSAYDALYARTIDLAGFILLSCIPNEPWMHDEFFEPKPGARIWCDKIAMMDNKLLPIEEIETAAAKWTEDEKQVRIYGNFRFLSGLVYKEFVKELAPKGHLCKPFKIPKSWPRWRALDHGNLHNTACLWGAVAPNETLYIYREYVANNKSVEQHAKAIIERSEGESYVGNTIIDPACFNRNQANLASIADEFSKHGVPCRPGIRTSSFGEFAVIQRVKRRLEATGALGPFLQVFSTCEHLVWEFRRWSYKTDKEGKPLASDGFQDMNNDALDALKYLVCANPCYDPKLGSIESPEDD